MVNRTDKEALAVHGVNPQHLIEYNIRKKIYDSVYWKQNCFGLSAETLIDEAIKLDHIGGTFGSTRQPTNFICLILKMLQIQLDKDVVIELIRNEEFKYIRILGAFYLRLTFKGIEVYRYLEPLYNDYRKIRILTEKGKFMLTHVDEIIDNLLRKDIMFDTVMQRIQYRYFLVKQGSLVPRLTIFVNYFDEAMKVAHAEAEEHAQITKELWNEIKTVYEQKYEKFESM